MTYDFKNFAKDLFDINRMQELLPKLVYDEYLEAYNQKTTLSLKSADVIATIVKSWAAKKGCTHYTHFFLPLSNISAEKQNILSELNGKTLIKDEPDASSFPSGGLRSTFEARGYTYWDLKSPMFVLNNTLYIPTIFISYKGNPLDSQGPLIKSKDILGEEVIKFLKLFNHHEDYVVPYVGLEQEYFLVDKDLFYKRKDLFLTGKTLFGSGLNQEECNKHYFARIPSRVKEFMDEVNSTLWNLGIMIKTQHNEVAPAQFELAPMHKEVNIACFENVIVMNVLKEVALKHNLVCLLHEKPFANLNGSGKHNNYSLVTSKGINLFKYEKKRENEFLLLITALLEAVDKNSDLLYLFSSNPSNEYRLGGNEAPPAIISVYLGNKLCNLLLNKEHQKNKNKDNPNFEIDIFDDEDRNRTSAIAYTGNKFEFRMLGSSSFASELNMCINLALADAINHVTDEIKSLKEKDEKSLKQLIKERYLKYERIVYNGNCYEDKFKEEIIKRKINNYSSYIYVIDSLVSDNAKKLFIKNKIFKEEDLLSRIQIKYEQYFYMKIKEIKVLINLINQEVIPAIINKLNSLILLKNLDNKYILEKIEYLNEVLNKLDKVIKQLEVILNHVVQNSNIKANCIYLHQQTSQEFNEARKLIDKIESIIENKDYMPTYANLLFKIELD